MTRTLSSALAVCVVLSGCTGNTTERTVAAPVSTLDDEQRCAAETRALGLDFDSMTATLIDDTPSPTVREFGCTARLTAGTFVDIHVPAQGDATFTSVVTGLPAATTACEHIFQVLMLTGQGVSGDPVRAALESTLRATDITEEQHSAVQRSLDQFTLDRTSPSFDPFGAYYDTIEVYRSTCPNGTPMP